jgi:enoyl-CoA hydratase/carnithine racemase
MEYTQILYNIVNGTALITLNRPERLNAWTRTMAAEVRDALYRAADNNNARVIVITGSGRGFCAGADMSELQDVNEDLLSNLDKNEPAEKRVSILMGQKLEQELDPENKKNIRADFRKRFSYISAIPKPVIAAVNGPIAGIGFAIALHCDMRFASKNAKFTVAFSKRGLIAEHGIAWLLPKIVGISNALDLLYTSRAVDGEEAMRIGLVNRVFEPDKLIDGTMAYAADLAATVSPRSLGVIKRQIYKAQFQTFAEASEDSDEELILSMHSEDFKEGIAHFLEKRPPVFKGK